MIDFKTLFVQTKDLTVLLVEDYEPLRNDMAEVLEDFFKTVVVAANGVEALTYYDAQHETHGKAFDIVISDIEMPLMNGVELSAKLRERNEKQQIIILSAHTDTEYLLGLINLGIAQFINKPIQHERLLDTLSFVCDKIHKEKEVLPESMMFDMGENIVWDKDKSLLMMSGEIVTLTRHEILLMQLLMQKEEQVCTNEDILAYFYLEDIDLEEKNIRNLVFKLRKKIPKNTIESIYGMGYKLRVIQ